MDCSTKIQKDSLFYRTGINGYRLGSVRNRGPPVVSTGGAPGGAGRPLVETAPILSGRLVGTTARRAAQDANASDMFDFVSASDTEKSKRTKRQPRERDGEREGRRQRVGPPGIDKKALTGYRAGRTDSCPAPANPPGDMLILGRPSVRGRISAVKSSALGSHRRLGARRQLGPLGAGMRPVRLLLFFGVALAPVLDRPIAASDRLSRYRGPSIHRPVCDLHSSRFQVAVLTLSSNHFLVFDSRNSSLDVEKVADDLLNGETTSIGHVEILLNDTNVLTLRQQHVGIMLNKTSGEMTRQNVVIMANNTTGEKASCCHVKVLLNDNRETMSFSHVEILLSNTNGDMTSC
ncbi:hypothetical protein J6590_068613 [Homalodisca vitripennis]|nr:hypothetical protein J6590_068613 [Homalodisca vitripennis]